MGGPVIYDISRTPSMEHRGEQNDDIPIDHRCGGDEFIARGEFESVELIQANIALWKFDIVELIFKVPAAKKLLEHFDPRKHCGYLFTFRIFFPVF